MNRDWAPDYLVRWLFEQDDVWITASRRLVFVASMEREHLLNTLLMLERVANSIEVHLPVATRVQDTVLYNTMRRRVLAEMGVFSDEA